LITILTKTVISFLQKPTCGHAVIAVGMAAGIVLMSTVMFLNLKEQRCYKKDGTNKVVAFLSINRDMAKAKRITTTKKEKLVRVNPSGREQASFFEQVYEIARQIPRGRVTSYGAIAFCLGTKLSARMVGWAMNGAGTVRPKVPAHRVVNRIGMLSGKHHFGGDTMQRLLEKEGIKVENDVVVDFEKKFWDPPEQLF